MAQGNTTNTDSLKEHATQAAADAKKIATDKASEAQEAAVNTKDTALKEVTEAKDNAVKKAAEVKESAVEAADNAQEDAHNQCQTILDGISGMASSAMNTTGDILQQGADMIKGNTPESK